MTPGRVSVGYLHPGELQACFVNSLIDMLFFDAFGEQRFVHQRGRMGNETGAGQLVAGRNQLAASFLDESDAEWLFMVDADMGFAHDTVERLIHSADPVERPVVGGLAFACKSDGVGEHQARRYRCAPTLYRMHQTEDEVGFVPIFDYPRNALVPVDATGGACILIHRTALERMRAQFGDKWFDTIELPVGKKGRTVFSEDLSFCLRLASIDVLIYVNTAVKTTHDKGAVFFDEEVYDLQQAQLGGFDGEPLIDVVIPTFGRPDQLGPLAVNVVSSTRNLAVVTFVIEPDDLESAAAIDAIPSAKVRRIYNEGPRSYAGAVNTAGAHLSAPWLFTGADDLRFSHHWDIPALKMARATGAKVIGTNDCHNPRVLVGEHSTHSLVAADYIATGATIDGAPGRVLHTYDHNYVDDELVQTAMRRDVYAHCHASRVEHVHPAWGLAETDATYEAGNARFAEDRAEFLQRMAS